MDEGGGGVRAGCIRIRCPSPRRIVSRWFSSHERKVKGKKTAAMAEARVIHCDEEVRVKTSSEDDPHLELGQSSDSTPRTIDSSELQRREFLFSIGVSCYLLHLIATGREEIQKIVELRSDIEKFLECRNEELRRKQQEFVELRNDIEKFLELHKDELRRKQREFHLGKQERSEISAAYSTTTSDVVDGPESSTDHYYSPQIMETSSMSVGGEEGSLSHYLFKRGDDFGSEMDQLEAELEAEFELLQISQGHDGQCSKLKEVSEKSEASEGLGFEQVCPGVVEEQQGVCPYELERRLHELMETRQEEEIKELEIALEDAKQRLHTKETEASWWKDTAYIVSERIPEPSSRIINSSSRTHHYPVSR